MPDNGLPEAREEGVAVWRIPGDAPAYKVIGGGASAGDYVLLADHRARVAAAQAECERLTATRAAIAEERVILRRDLDEAQRYWDKADRDMREERARADAAEARLEAAKGPFWEAAAHIGAARAQLIDSDDAVIAGHIRDAEAELGKAVGAISSPSTISTRPRVEDDHGNPS